jgi:hypothetical protein
MAGTPTASIATSTPSPSLSSQIRSAGVLGRGVDRRVGAQLLGARESAIGEIHRHDAARSPGR